MDGGSTEVRRRSNRGRTEVSAGSSGAVVGRALMVSKDHEEQLGAGYVPQAEAFARKCHAQVL